MTLILDRRLTLGLSLGTRMVLVLIPYVQKNSTHFHCLHTDYFFILLRSISNRIKKKWMRAGVERRDKNS